MFQVALKMLFHDSGKYLGLVLGLAFSILLINQQSTIFIGMLGRSMAMIKDVPQANLWVMEPGTTNLETALPMRDIELARVRGVRGVQWAVPMIKANAVVRSDSGELRFIEMQGVDEASLIGVPTKFLMGSPQDLRRPEAVAISRYGFQKLWPGEPLSLGKVLEVNDHRAVVVAIVEEKPRFLMGVTLFTRYSQALLYANLGRHQMSHVLVQTMPGEDPEVVADRIQERTGLHALSAQEAYRLQLRFFLFDTGIPVVMGMLVLLGIFVGAAIVGLMFNQFVLENLRHFAVLKALGVRNTRLVALVLWQATVVGVTGYSIGLGAVSLFFQLAKANPSFRGYFLPWQVALGSAVIAAGITIFASLLALRRVLRVEPAVVFRG